MRREQVMNKCGNMLIIGELGWKVYGIFLCSSYTFPVSLKWYLNKNFLIKNLLIMFERNTQYFEWQSISISYDKEKNFNLKI